MTETWRELKLAEIQADMDQTATSLANRKDESDSSRKKLIVERNPSNLFGSNNPIYIFQVIAVSTNESVVLKSCKRKKVKNSKKIAQKRVENRFNHF